MSATKSRLNTSQLPLEIHPNDEATFVNFCWGSNTLLEHQLKASLSFESERFLYIFGNAGSGKSHILQACCQAFHVSQSAIYLPLNVLKNWGPDSLTDLDTQTLICVDDIQVIGGDPVFEEALFHLYNRIRDKGEGVLIVSAQNPPSDIPIQLPDLRSRLASGLIFQLQELSDEEKVQVLQRQALQRGFELSPGVAQYLLTRYSRNMQHLYEMLQKLDEASLAAHRKITIPFVKTVFE